MVVVCVWGGVCGCVGGSGPQLVQWYGQSCTPVDDFVY